MRQKLILLSLALIAVFMLHAKPIDLLSISSTEIDQEVLSLVQQNNQQVDRTAPVWNFGTITVPVPIPRPGDPRFDEDIPWTKDFSPHIQYSGTNPLYLFYTTPTQRFNITTDPSNPLALTFTTRQQYWFGSETILIGVAETPVRDPNRNYHTAVLRVTVSPVDNNVVIECPPGTLPILITENTSRTIDFTQFIRTVDDLNDPTNFTFLITQTQVEPYDIPFVQHPPYTGKVVTFTPRPNFFGDVTMAVTNIDNIIYDNNYAGNVCDTTFVIRIVNVNDAPVITEWSPLNLQPQITRGESLEFFLRAHDVDDLYLTPPNTSMNFQWRITGSHYGVPINLILPGVQTPSPSHPMGVQSTIDYTFNYPGQFTVSVVVSDSVLVLDPLVWNVTVLPTGPEFTIPGGTYDDAISVGLFSSFHPSAPIYYTLDGSVPDQNSFLFDPANPILIQPGLDDTYVTITAVYYTVEFGASEVVSQTYHVTGRVADPIFSLIPMPHYYTSIQSLAISSATAGASIRYTLDGTDPGSTEGILYVNPIEIPYETILNIKAIAFKNQWRTSEIVQSAFEVTGRVQILNIEVDQELAPYAHLLPVGATLPLNFSSIILSPSDAQTRLYYTLDNTEPTETSTLFQGETIEIGQPTRVRFKAYRINWAPSLERIFDFNVEGQVQIAEFPHGSQFSPAPWQTYSSPIYVEINSTIPAQNSQIYYTISYDPLVMPPDPDNTSTLYMSSSQIYIPAHTTATIKAIAYHSVLSPSPIYTASYVVTGQVLTPTFTPPEGSYTSSQNVVISTPTPAANVYYTISYDPDQAPPDPDQSSFMYVNPIVVPDGYTLIKARAYKDFWTPSPVQSATYFVNMLDAPDFLLADGVIYYEPIDVALSHPDPLVTIRYNLNGDEPTETSTPYTGPIHLTQSRTITARAFKTGLNPSRSVQRNYVITGTVATPSFFINNPGTYQTAIQVGLQSTTPSAIIRYTTDGSTPTATYGIIYSGPITVSSTSEIKAIAYRPGWLPSGVLSGVYTISGTVAMPSFTPPPGIYRNPVEVYLFSATPNAQIRYTTDGSIPSQSIGQLFNPANPILVNANTQIRAIAWVDGGFSSAVALGSYEITGRVATPVFNPIPGTYALTQSVSINTSTPGADIYYTLDGSTPDENSNLFLTPITVSQSVVIKAIAIKENWDDSGVTTGSYIINGQISTPIFVPGSGVYFEDKLVSISVFPSDASVRYTTDGSEPTLGNGIVYNPANPIVISQNTTLKAKAFKALWNDSNTATAVYDLNVRTPEASHPAGVYAAGFDLSLVNPTPGAGIYYTTDGTAPSMLNGILYSSPINVSANMIIRARSFKNGWNPSPELSLNFVINGAVAMPTFNPMGGIYNAVQELIISSSTAGATIYYTTDGSTPSALNGITYVAPVIVDRSMLIRAIAVRDTWLDSAINQANYVLQTNAPMFSHSGGSYSDVLTLSLSSPTPGSQIRYTLDGTDPTLFNGLVYSAPIVLSSDTVVKAMTVRDGWQDSAIVTHTYTFAVAPIVITPPGGLYAVTQNVQLSTSTPNTEIRYTLDGSVPTTGYGMIYSGPIVVSEPLTLKAIAYHPTMTSASAEAIYSFVLLPPAFSLQEGTYNTAQSLAFSHPIAGTLIRYTTDGSDPSVTSGNVYSAPITIDMPGTVKAIAIKDAWTSSIVVGRTYQFKTINPVFTPTAGLYMTAQELEISSPSIGNVVYYTTDQTAPNASSNQYTSPISLPENSQWVFKAIATKAGWLDSDAVEAGYIIGQTILPTVSAPVFNPGSNLYYEPQMVTISSSTAGAQIRYTTDGSTPDEINGQLYLSPINVNNSQTIKAIAYKADHNPSSVSTAVYQITGQVSLQTPFFTPAAGTYQSIQNITLNTSTTPAGAVLRYTLDGSEPNELSASYISPIALPLNSNTTIRVRAYSPNWLPSEIVSATYIITGQVATVSINPNGGSFNDPVLVNLSTATTGASIRYTTDGSDPGSTNGMLYSAPFMISTNTLLKAIAYQSGWTSSAITQAQFTMNVNAPVFSLDSGIYTSAQTLSLSTTTAGATIRYTTDGTDPSASFGSIYSTPINIAASQTVKAIAFKDNWTSSAVINRTYIITGQVTLASPFFTPTAGTYQTAQNITLNTATTPAGAVLRYTLDGSEPNELSASYLAPIALPLGSNTTIRVRAYSPNWLPSEIVSATYIITGQVATVSINPNGGSFNDPVLVNLSTATSGASIRYTTDGSDPSSTNGMLYSAPFMISTNTLLKAIAYQSGWTSSAITQAQFNMNVNAPVFSLDSGIYTSAQSLNLSSATGDAIIRYTVDGTDPTPTSGTVYSGTITIATSQTVKAIAYKENLTASAVVSRSYTITGQVTMASPLFTPAAGTYQTAQNITLNTTTTPVGAVLRYTLDGSDPNELSASYISPIALPLNSTTTIRVRAYSPNWLPSTIVSATYIITGQVATVSINPNGGSFNDPVLVNLSTATSGASIRYTTDGTDPSSTGGTLYSAPFTISNNTVLKAIAYQTNWTTSAITQAQFTLNVNAPVFSLDSGVYTSAQILSLSTTTAGATIRYTTNGSDPSPTNGTIYSTPINISSSQVIKAIAYRANWTSSAIVTRTYTITGQASLSTPVFNPPAGVYTTAQHVSLASVTITPANATVRYTMDNSDPTETSEIYTGPISLDLNQTVTVKFRAFANDWLASPVYSATYVMTGVVSLPDPLFTPAPGLYNTAQFISINTGSYPAGAQIYYTLDGTEPTQSSTPYTSAIALATDTQTTISVKAFKQDWIPSQTYTADYTITGQVSVSGNFFSPAAGVYTEAQQISITPIMYPASATIRYTTDGSEPDEASDIYTSPISIPLNTPSLTIRAKAYYQDWIPSNEISATYSITGQVILAANTFGLAPGTYTTAQTLTLASPVLPVGAIIRYTLDGSEPTSQSAAYSAPIVLGLDSSYVVKAKGFATNWVSSETVSASYLITGTVSDPVFSFDSGIYSEEIVLSLSNATVGSVIRYTTDGSEPDANSTVYSEPIRIAEFTQNLQIKAKAFKPQWVNSQSIQKTYSVLPLPINVRAFSYSGYIRVIWNSPVVSRSLQGFNVYRRRLGEASFTKLNTALVTATQDSIYYYDDYAISHNRSYQYYVTAVYNGMESNASLTTTIEYQSQELVISDASHAYPNPAATQTKIKLIMSRNDNVQLTVSIFDFAGKKVKTLTSPTQNANLIEIPWDLKNENGVKVARGVYFAKIVANDGVNRSEKVIKIAVK